MQIQTQTLPGDWTPTASGCQQTGDYWAWSYGHGEGDWTVMGGPSQTTDCLAPTWVSNLTYAGSQCPPHYTSALCNPDAVTCCPTAHQFVCATPAWTWKHWEYFKCISVFENPGDRFLNTLTVTDFEYHTTSHETRTFDDGIHIYALAMVYSSPSQTADDNPSKSTDTEKPSSKEDGGTSSGMAAGAGIGVGASAAAVLLCLAAWWLFRRRRQRHGAVGDTQHLVPPTDHREPAPDGSSWSPPSELPAVHRVLELPDRGAGT